MGAMQSKLASIIRDRGMVGVLVMAEGLRPLPIEYFVPEDLERARAWVAAAGRQ